MSDQTSHQSTAPEPTAPEPTARRSPAVIVLVGVLCAAPVVALMWVSSYAKQTPRLWGMPFFYWYQFLWVFLAAGCTYTAYRIVLATTPRRRFGGSESRRTPGGER